MGVLESHRVAAVLKLDNDLLACICLKKKEKEKKKEKKKQQSTIFCVSQPKVGSKANSPITRGVRCMDTHRICTSALT